MAPVGMTDMLSWASSPEVGIISLVVFLVLSITLVGLCARCHRNSGNAYDVSGSATADAAGGTNGIIATSTKTEDTPDFQGADSGTLGWRSHSDMPPSTLERSHTSTQ